MRGTPVRSGLGSAVAPTRSAVRFSLISSQVGSQWLSSSYQVVRFEVTLPSSTPIVPPLVPGYTPNRKGSPLLVAVFQNANAPSKPGRSPPERRSTAFDHFRPVAVSAGGAPVLRPSTGWIAATVAAKVVGNVGGGFSGNCNGTRASAAAVTVASRK